MSSPKNRASAAGYPAELQAQNAFHAHARAVKGASTPFLKQTLATIQRQPSTDEAETRWLIERELAILEELGRRAEGPFALPAAITPDPTTPEKPGA